MILDDRHIRAVASGDHTAFRRMFDALESRMLFYARRLVGDRPVSEDIVQDAFVLYWDRREQFDTVLAAKAFVYTTIRHKVSRHMRNDATRRAILGHIASDPDAQDADGDDDLAVVAEICGQIRAAVDRLAPQSRRVVEMSMGGMTVDQVAAALGISPNSVKTLKKAAYRHLREQLDHLGALLLFLF